MTSGFEITIFTKSRDQLSKSITVVDGALRSDGSQCRMSTGSAERIFCDNLDDLKKTIEGCTSNQALAIGRLKDGLPSPVEIVCKGKLADHPGAICRSLENFEFADGPGICLLDFDGKGAPADLDPLAALTQVLPDLDFVAYVERASTSSGIRDAAKSYPGSNNRHFYILVEDQRDIPRFLRALQDRLWLAGFGWGTVSAVGGFLVRSVIDIAVGSPERLVFEGPPRLAPGLVQAPRPAIVRNPAGKALDTNAACPNLSKADAAKVAKLRKADEQRLLPERKQKRDEWSAPRIAALVSSGIDAKEARARVARAIDDSKLYGEFILQFDGEPDVSVSDVFANPDRFVGKALSDPHEGPSYGTGKARLYRQEDGAFVINSFAHGGRKYELLSAEGRVRAVELEDFWFLMPKEGACIFAPTGTIWPASNVNMRLPKVQLGTDEEGKTITCTPSAYLAKHRSVEQMTWSPGDKQIITDKLFTVGGWMPRPGARTFNLYSPPEPMPAIGDPAKAQIYIDHVRRIYPEDADHLFDCFAHRVQKPHEKINHAIVLGGPEGIGKDTTLEPVKKAIGPWNFRDVDPATVMGRFSGWRKCVILRVSEARDQGEFDRYKFADHMKVIIAAPPDVLMVDEKNTQEYYVTNCCFVIYTTNHRTDALYVTVNDRRHYFMWSHSKKEDFDPAYWNALWRFYEEENGYAHIRAFLEKRDLSAFDPKAPPKRNDAFFAALTASKPAEEGEFSDVLDAMGERDAVTQEIVRPDVFTLEMVLKKATTMAEKDVHGSPKAGSFALWLGDRKNRRTIPHRMHDCDYSPLPNKSVCTGMWRVDGKRQMIYVKDSLSPDEQQEAAEALANPPPPYGAGEPDNVVPLRAAEEVRAPRSTWYTNDPDEVEF
jgi:Family of unknown function (DUF5906)